MIHDPRNKDMKEISCEKGTSRILALAQSIASQTALIDKHLREHKLPEPSFVAGTPVEPIGEVEKAKTSVIAFIGLRQLLEGPAKELVPESNFALLMAMHRFKIASSVHFAESFPAHIRAIDAIAEKSEEPNITGYAVPNGTNLNIFEFLNANPDRAKRFV